jgi:hypothetical protein
LAPSPIRRKSAHWSERSFLLLDINIELHLPTGITPAKVIFITMRDSFYPHGVTNNIGLLF